MTAIRVNLLPHREQRRALQQRALVATLAITALAGLLAVGVGHVVIAGMQETQNARNTFLKDRIAELDKRISEIAELKQKTSSLLSRKQVVETLQVNRAEVVHLFDELARRLPDGMYLKGFKQSGDKLSMNGYAQSSARVSTLMRNIEASQWMASPVLIEVRSARLNNRRVHEFILEARQKVPGAAPVAAEPDKVATP
jgi:type IV pilus assembly protein PilN